MGEFLVFVLIVFGAGWGSAFLLPYLRRHSQGLDRTVDHEVIARLLEDTDQLSTRLNRVEEDLDFFKDLNAPEGRRRLTSPGGEVDEDGGVESENEGGQLPPEPDGQPL